MHIGIVLLRIGVGSGRPFIMRIRIRNTSLRVSFHMTHFLLKVFVIEQKTSRQFAVKYNSRVLYRYVYYCVC